MVTVSKKALLTKKGKTHVLGMLLSTSSEEIEFLGNSIVHTANIECAPGSNLTVGRAAHVDDIFIQQAGTLKLLGTSRSVSLSRSGSFQCNGGMIEGNVLFFNTTKSFIAVNTLFSSNIFIYNTNGTIRIQSTNEGKLNSVHSVFGPITMTGIKGDAILHNVSAGDINIRGKDFGRLELFSSSIRKLTGLRVSVNFFDNTIREILHLTNCVTLLAIGFTVFGTTDIDVSLSAIFRDTHFSKSASISLGVFLNIVSSRLEELHVSYYTSVYCRDGQFGHYNFIVFHVTALVMKNVTHIDKFSSRKITSVLTKGTDINTVSLMDQTSIRLAESVFYDLFCRQSTSVTTKNVTVIGAAFGACDFVV